MVISNNNKHELPNEFPDDLRLKILGNWEIPQKSQDFLKL